MPRTPKKPSAIAPEKLDIASLAKATGGFSLNATINKTVKSDSYKTVYSNFSKVGITQWDLTLVFGVITEGTEGEGVNEEFIAIKLSPQYFKAVANSLTAAIQQWEATFGEIPVGLGQKGNADAMTNAFEKLKSVMEKIDSSKIG